MITLGFISSISLILLLFPHLKQMWNTRRIQAVLLRRRNENLQDEEAPAPQEALTERSHAVAGSRFAQDIGSRDSIYDNFELYRMYVSDRLIIKNLGRPRINGT